MTRMKFNRLTHFTIIVFLAVTFIVIYLYYTIKDVKRISTEVQKLSKDVLSLSQSISSITSTLLTQAPVCYAPIATSVPTNSVNITAVNTGSAQEASHDSDIQADDVSETADDLHKIIETIDDEEHKDRKVDITELTDKEISMETQRDHDLSRLDVKDLKALPYDTLKKYCKERGIDAKGTKETLISKILSS